MFGWFCMFHWQAQKPGTGRCACRQLCSHLQIVVNTYLITFTFVLAMFVSLSIWLVLGRFVFEVALFARELLSVGISTADIGVTISAGARFMCQVIEFSQHFLQLFDNVIAEKLLCADLIFPRRDWRMCGSCHYRWLPWEPVIEGWRQHSQVEVHLWSAVPNQQWGIHDGYQWHQGLADACLDFLPMRVRNLRSLAHMIPYDISSLWDQHVGHIFRSCILVSGRQQCLVIQPSLQAGA